MACLHGTRYGIIRSIKSIGPSLGRVRLWASEAIWDSTFSPKFPPLVPREIAAHPFLTARSRDGPYLALCCATQIAWSVYSISSVPPRCVNMAVGVFLVTNGRCGSVDHTKVGYSPAR